MAMIFIKYRPVYEVTVAGEKIGYIRSLSKFKNLIQEEIINQKGTNIAFTTLKNEPAYEKKLVSRAELIEEQNLIQELKENNTNITYKYYEVSLNNETKACVDTIEDAEKIVKEIKEEFCNEELELEIQIQEQYTLNSEEINTETLEIASNNVEEAAKIIEENSKALAIINDVKLSVLPVNGNITSRYGERSSIRRSTHTGLDIACSTGTPIKTVAEGTVIFASSCGSYGNLVKIDHGNGVETWYGHCSKICTTVGDKVNAGDLIALVGSTGNSTGPHLHLEIRIDGQTVNPQNYLY